MGVSMEVLAGLSRTVPVRHLVVTLCCLATLLTSARVALAAEQNIAAPRGSLSVYPAGESFQIVRWVGPSSTELAWPQLDSKHYTLLSLRVVPKGLAQVGLVAALTPTWGLELAGVPMNDDDMAFLVKRCHYLSILRLRHPSTLSRDELSDLTEDERGLFDTRALSGDGLAKIERLKRLMALEITGYTLPETRLQFLSELKELRWLTLCDMPINDEDLRALAQLPKLARLDLSGTSVTGSGLKYLCDCPALQWVMLNRTPLASNLPAMLKDHPLPQLRQLHVHGCKLGPEKLIALRNAVPMFGSVIDSDYSLRPLVDAAPPGPGNPQEIRAYRAACQLLWGLDVAAFRLAKKAVTDVSVRPRGWAPAGDWVLSCVAPLKGVKNLWLAGCNFSPEALERLQTHSQLEWLDLSHSSLDDAGLARLVGLTRLRGINLSLTKLTDACVESLLRFSNLETLFLCETHVTDRGLRALGSSWRLRMLDLKKCTITDEGARRLSEMLNLEYVRLDDTKVSDHGVAALANLPSLRGLSCVNCKITDRGADPLLRAANLAYCKLEGTSISGHLRTMIADHVSDVRTSLRMRPGSPSSAQSRDPDFWNLDSSTTSTQAGRRY
jgi:hypothetical protein